MSVDISTRVCAYGVLCVHCISLSTVVLVSACGCWSHFFMAVSGIMTKHGCRVVVAKGSLHPYQYQFRVRFMWCIRQAEVLRMVLTLP